MTSLTMILVAYFVGYSEPYRIEMLDYACYAIEDNWKAGNVKEFVFKEGPRPVSRIECEPPPLDPCECQELETQGEPS